MSINSAVRFVAVCFVAFAFGGCSMTTTLRMGLGGPETMNDGATTPAAAPVQQRQQLRQLG